MAESTKPKRNRAERKNKSQHNEKQQITNDLNDDVFDPSPQEQQVSEL